MVTKRQEIKCPWCNEVLPATAVKLGEAKSDFGTVVERRCSKCGKVLAAYLKEEGEFLGRMRLF